MGIIRFDQFDFFPRISQQTFRSRRYLEPPGVSFADQEEIITQQSLLLDNFTGTVGVRDIHTNETGTSSINVTLLTFTQLSLIRFITISAVKKTGTMVFLRYTIRINDSTGAAKFFAHGYINDNNQASQSSFNVNHIIVENGDTIRLDIRRNVTNADYEISAQVVFTTLE